MYGLMKTLKFGTSLIMCLTTGTLSKSMYDFTKSGMVGLSSSCNFLLQQLNEASIYFANCWLFIYLFIFIFIFIIVNFKKNKMGPHPTFLRTSLLFVTTFFQFMLVDKTI